MDCPLETIVDPRIAITNKKEKKRKRKNEWRKSYCICGKLSDPSLHCLPRHARRLSVNIIFPAFCGNIYMYMIVYVTDRIPSVMRKLIKVFTIRTRLEELILYAMALFIRLTLLPLSFWNGLPRH